MSTHFQIEHDFPGIEPELFERYLNHPDLNKMLAKMPGFRSRELVEEKRLKNGEVKWRFKVVAGGEVPPAIQRVLSPEMFSWWEDTRFVPKEHCVYWKIEPLMAKGKFEGEGTWLLNGDARGTQRVIEGEINVRIPLIGKVIENFIIAELKRNYEVEPDIQRKFYAKMKKQT